MGLTLSRRRSMSAGTLSSSGPPSLSRAKIATAGTEWEVPAFFSSASPASTCRLTSRGTAAEPEAAPDCSSW